jgi:hypothetical protein
MAVQLDRIPGAENLAGRQSDHLFPGFSIEPKRGGVDRFVAEITFAGVDQDSVTFGRMIEERVDQDFT